jgi:low temperature requirement protein LtrA
LDPVTDMQAQVPVPVVPAEPSASEVVAERRTSPVELLWDLVFVYAVTQVATILAHRPAWGRFGEAMLLLALVWWAWSAFVWAANAQSEDSRSLRAVMLAATALIFLVGLALPQAFAAEGILFAVAYILVRLLHLGLYVDASRQGNAAWSAIAGFGVTVLVGMAMLLAGAVLLHGWGRALLWTAAAAIDYAGPAWLTRQRLRGLQHVAVAHFAERYGSFVIICLGESILAVGVGLGTATDRLTAAQVVGAVLALLIAIGLWWTYFDRFAERAQVRLRHHPDPVLAAADAYSYIHLIIVAGIIIFAGGMRLVVRDSVGTPMPITGRLYLCGGVALYLLGLAAFRWRIAGERGVLRPLAAGAVLILAAAGGGLPAWAIGALIAGVLGGLCAAESIVESSGGARSADGGDPGGGQDSRDLEGEPEPAPRARSTR